MKDKSLLATGVIGTLILSLCCFTPFLVVLFGFVEFSDVVGYLDYVPLPALGVIFVITF